MRKIKMFAFAIMIWAATISVSAQQPKIDRNQLYLLSATLETPTAQKELDEASALGFRAVMGAPAANGEILFFLERTAQPPDTYKYKLLATTLTGTMQKELDEAAAEGFRIVPQTLMAKRELIGAEIVVLLERPPRVDKHYEYKLIASNLTSTLERELTIAHSLGFNLAAMVSRVEHIAILEREVRR